MCGAHDETAYPEAGGAANGGAVGSAPVHDLDGPNAVAAHQLEVGPTVRGHRNAVRASPIGQYRIGQRRGGQAVDSYREGHVFRCTSGHPAPPLSERNPDVRGAGPYAMLMRRNSLGLTPRTRLNAALKVKGSV